MSFLEYAPAPESQAILNLRDELRPVHRRRVRRRAAARRSRRSRPATEKHIADDRARATRADVDAAVAAARRAYDTTWSKHERARPRQVPVPHRPPRAGARPRARRRREPRQRQADQGEPRRRRAARRRLVLLLRRLGRQARLRRARRRTRARSASPRRSSRGTSRCSCSPGRSPRRSPRATPSCSSPPRPRRSPRCSSPRSCSRPTCPPGVVNIITGAGETGAALVQPSGRQQGRLHRLDRRRPRDRQGDRRAPARSSRSSSAARPRTSSSTTRRSTRPSRASSTASSSTRATSAAPGQPPARAGEHPRRGRRPAQAAALDAAPRRPARQEHRHRRDQLARAARPHPRAQRHRRGRRAPSAGRADCVIPENGLLVRADDLHNVSTSHRIARDEIFGPVLSVLTFRTPAEAIAKANNTPYGLSAGIWSDKGIARSSPSPTSCAPA